MIRFCSILNSKSLSRTRKGQVTPWPILYAGIRPCRIYRRTVDTLIRVKSATSRTLINRSAISKHSAIAYLTVLKNEKKKRVGPEVWDYTLQRAHGYPCSFALAAHPDFNRLLVCHLAVSRENCISSLAHLTTPNRLFSHGPIPNCSSGLILW